MSDGTFDLHERYDVDEINKINRSLYAARYNSGDDVLKTLKKEFRARYNYDIKPHQGPFLAVVLKVVSGPQLKEKAASSDNPITTTITNMNYLVILRG